MAKKYIHVWAKEQEELELTKWDWNIFDKSSRWSLVKAGDSKVSKGWLKSPLLDWRAWPTRFGPQCFFLRLAGVPWISQQVSLYATVYCISHTKFGFAFIHGWASAFAHKCWAIRFGAGLIQLWHHPKATCFFTPNLRKYLVNAGLWISPKNMTSNFIKIFRQTSEKYKDSTSFHIFLKRVQSVLFSHSSTSKDRVLAR